MKLFTRSNTSRSSSSSFASGDFSRAFCGLTGMRILLQFRFGGEPARVFDFLLGGQSEIQVGEPADLDVQLFVLQDEIPGGFLDGTTQVGLVHGKFASEPPRRLFMG